MNYTPAQRLDVGHLDLFERGYWDKSTPRARRQPKKRARQLEQQVCRTERWVKYQ